LLLTQDHGPGNNIEGYRYTLCHINGKNNLLRRISEPNREAVKVYEETRIRRTFIFVLFAKNYYDENTKSEIVRYASQMTKMRKHTEF
jgi:hypothetical protein